MCNFHLMSYYCSPNLSIHQNSTQERYLVFITSFRKPSNEIIFNSAHVAAKFLCPIRFFSSLSILLSHSFLFKGNPRFKYFIFFQIHLIRPYDLLPSIRDGVLRSGMLLYLHHRDSKIFFHPAKLDNFKDEKISDFKTVSVSQRKNLLD